MKEMNSVNTEIMHINSLCTNVWGFFKKHHRQKLVFYAKVNFEISVSFAP